MCSLNKGLQETSLGLEDGKVAVWEREHKKDGKKNFSDWKTGVGLKTYSPDCILSYIFSLFVWLLTEICVLKR